MPSDGELYRQALLLDFLGFNHRCFREINPTTPFDPNWHIEVMGAALEDCRHGRNRRLIINVPPRSLKSLTASVAYPAWLLGQNPSTKIITASYGQDLSDKHARDCRQIMNSQFYRELFPGCQLSDRQAVQEYETTAGGLRYSTSVGGPFTGRGSDFIIIDDPLKPEQALSDRERISANNWFSNTVRTRLDDQRTGVIIIIMQRLHMDDLVGHVLQSDQWKVLRFPAIAEEREVHVIETIHGRKTFVREAGEALHPTRQSLEILNELKNSMTDYDFSGQYQQAPVPLGGGMIKYDWFQYFDRVNPPVFDQIVQSWDTASKPGNLNDYSVCTTWGIASSKFYLLNVYRERVGYPELKRAVVEQARLFRPDTILIEDKSSGTALIQDLITDGVHRIQGYKPKDDKKMRMNSQTATIQNGFVFLPSHAHWVADYLHEMTSFYFGKHDDQVDSTSQFLDWAKIIEPAIITHARQEAERQQRPAHASIRVQRPATSSSGTVIFADRTQMNVPADGIIWIRPEDFGPLNQQRWTRIE
jgi:predicted phage terminase large subunit-like protein